MIYEGVVVQKFFAFLSLPVAKLAYIFKRPVGPSGAAAEKESIRD
jgi:hypothetical protein